MLKNDPSHAARPGGMIFCVLEEKRAKSATRKLRCFFDLGGQKSKIIGDDPAIIENSFAVDST